MFKIHKDKPIKMSFCILLRNLKGKLNQRWNQKQREKFKKIEKSVEKNKTQEMIRKRTNEG